MGLSENKEIIYKTLIILGSLSLSVGIGNYMYNYYKKLKLYQEDYNQKLKLCLEDFNKNIENNENNKNNEDNENK